MILKAVDIKEFDFTGYGTYYNMTGDRDRVYRTLGEDFEDYMTKTPLIDTPGAAGIYRRHGCALCCKGHGET